MIRKIAIVLISAALAAGCHRTQKLERGNQNYQVVQEGQASGVTSTINGPGETPPPVTDTAVDTTTNFTLPDNPAPLGSMQPQPSTVAGTLPTYPQPYPSASTPRPVQRTAPPPMSSSTPARPVPPPPAQSTQPPPTDTTATATQPPPTDTSTTTSTQPPPPSDEGKAKKDKKGDKKDKDQQGEQTDTSTTSTQPPPPPPLV